MHLYNIKIYIAVLSSVSDTASVLGQTFSILIIQDFEAVTPNILARIVECIEGGGLIIVILPSVQTLQEVAVMEMVMCFSLYTNCLLKLFVNILFPH